MSNTLFTTVNPETKKVPEEWQLAEIQAGI
jgi:hypothetical protein